MYYSGDLDPHMKPKLTARKNIAERQLGTNVLTPWDPWPTQFRHGEKIVQKSRNESANKNNQNAKGDTSRNRTHDLLFETGFVNGR